jgi:hypothetical protein
VAPLLVTYSVLLAFIAALCFLACFYFCPRAHPLSFSLPSSPHTLPAAMSSDFESLSCDDNPSDHDHHHRRSSSNSSFDSLDDLVAEQDLQLLRRLPMVADSHNLRRRLVGNSDDDDDDPAAAYGHRQYGVTGPQPRTSIRPSSHTLLTGLPPALRDVPSSAHDADSNTSSGKEMKNANCGGDAVSVTMKSTTDAAAQAGQRAGEAAKGDVRLFTQQPKASPDLPLPLQSDDTKTTLPDMHVVEGRSAVPPIVPVVPCTATELHVSAPEDGREEATGQQQQQQQQQRSCRVSSVLQVKVEAAEQGSSRYRTAAGVDVEDTSRSSHHHHYPASPVLLQQQQQRDNFSDDAAPHPSWLWQATCPPDSGQITPTTSAGTLTASATTRRSDAGDDGAVGATELHRPSPQLPQQQQQTSSSSSSSADTRGCGSSPEVEAWTDEQPTQHHHQQQQQQLPAAAQMQRAVGATRAFHDVDGFYRTALLEESTDAEDDDDDAAGSSNDRAASSLTLTLRSKALSPPSLPSSVCTSESVATPPTTLRVKLASAAEELHRVAAALPHVTVVSLLSLLIIVLVPINVLCLDVMALAWIRRRVDTRYHSVAGLVSNSNNHNDTICGASASAVDGGRLFGTSSVVQTGPHCSDKFVLDPLVSTVARCRSTASAIGSSVSVMSTGGGGAASLDGGAPMGGGATTHAVPALCTFVLWLMIPNGLLLRALLLSHYGGVDAADLGGVACAAATLYARLRRQAPQLIMMELYVRYACLWAMVHAILPVAMRAGVWLDSWMPTNGSPPHKPGALSLETPATKQKAFS